MTIWGEEILSSAATDSVNLGLGRPCFTYGQVEGVHILAAGCIEFETCAHAPSMCMIFQS